MALAACGKGGKGVSMPNALMEQVAKVPVNDPINRLHNMRCKPASLGESRRGSPFPFLTHIPFIARR